MGTQVGSRYLKGFVVVRMNSVEDFGDDPNDCVIKNFWVKATQNEIKEWELIAGIEVETVDIGADGVDSGGVHIQHGVLVYRIPFPYDPIVRKAIIRSFIAHPKFFVA